MSASPTSVNGSSETGNCSNYANRACNDPASSVLFDGHIPTLTGLDGDTWASQLLTIQESSVLITFDFTATPNYTGVEAVEVVSFSCLEWGMTTREIKLAVNRGSNLFIVAGQLISTDSRSCEHLVRYCIQGESAQKILMLEFNFISANDWLHLAEVRFHTNSSACPHDTIITPPPPPTATPPPATTSPPAPATTNTSPAGNNLSQVPDSPQITPTTSANNNTENTASTTEELPDIILIAVPASLAFLLLLAVFTVAILIILCKCKHRKPNTNSLARDVDLEKYAAVSGDKPPLPGGGEAGASALHVQVYTEVNIVNHPTQTHQETESGMDQLYDQVDIKTNIRRVPPSAVTTENIMSQYSELQASDPVDQLYAQVDKKKGKKKKHGVDSQPSVTPSSQAADMAPSEPVDQLYAQVDKKQKGKKKTKEPADLHSSETVPSQPPVMELYAQVDKKKKRKKNDSEPSYSEPPAELYAQVDKKIAKQGSSATGDSQYVETESPMDQLYAQVDKKKKGKKKAKESKEPTSPPEAAVDVQVDKKKQKSKKKEVCPDESGAVYSVVNKPSPPQIPAKSQQLLEEIG